MRRPLLALTWLILLPSISAAQTAPSSTPAEAVLAPGDSLHIMVWRHPEFSGDFVVGPGGVVMHPIFRDVQVAGIPLPTVEANLRQFLTTFDKEPRFVVEPLFRVAVSGEVQRPQVFAVPPQTTITDAVVRAGGPTPNAARSRVRVLRSDKGGAPREFVVDLENPSRGLGLTPIRSGDMIIVDRRRSFFRDVLIPGISIAGSIAALGLLLDRYR